MIDIFIHTYYNGKSPVTSVHGRVLISPTWGIEHATPIPRSALTWLPLSIIWNVNHPLILLQGIYRIYMWISTPSCCDYDKALPSVFGSWTENLNITWRLYESKLSLRKRNPWVAYLHPDFREGWCSEQIREAASIPQKPPTDNVERFFVYLKVWFQGKSKYFGVLRIYNNKQNSYLVVRVWFRIGNLNRSVGISLFKL